MSELRQSTLNFTEGSSPPARARNESDSPQPVPSKTKRKKRAPVRQAFDHGRVEDGYVSGGEDVSDHDEEITLTQKKKRKTDQGSSGEEAGSSEGSEQDSENEEEADSEEMMDLEAEDDEDYQSGDSLDEDEGGNSRRRKGKKKNKGKARAQDEDIDFEVQIMEPTKKNKEKKNGKKSRIVESDDEVIVEEPVASTSAVTINQPSPASAPPSAPAPSKPQSRSRQVHSQFLGVIIPEPRRQSLSRSPSFTSKPPSKSPKKKNSPPSKNDSSSDSDSPPPVKTSSSSSKKSKGKKRAVVSSSSSDSDLLPEPEYFRSQNKKKHKRDQGGDSEPRKKSQKKEEKKVKGKLKKLTQKRDRRSDASEEESDDSEGRFVVDDDEEVEEDEWSDSERERVLGEDEARRRRKEEERIRAADKEEVKRKRLAREKKKKQVEEQATKRAGVVDDEEEEEEPVKSQKAKRTTTRKGKITNKKRRKHSDEDEGPEDLEILDEETVIDQRLRGSISTVASKFEQIRAARANRNSSSQQQIVINLSGDERGSPEARAPRPTYMGQSESEEEQDDDEDSDSGSGDSEQGEAEVDSDNFIVSDEEGDLANAEAQAELDTLRESMRVKAQGLKYFLKTYLNYLVHLIVVPEARWSADPEFKEAKDRVESHLQGIINSSLSSAGWLPKFKHTVDTRPDLFMSDLTETPPCDACAQGKTRRATFVGTFSGAKYDQKTLQPLNSSDDSSEGSSSESSSSSDSDESEEEQDVFGRMMKKKGKKKGKVSSKDKKYEYNLGKHCAGRAEVYHSFQHWPYTTKLRLEKKVRPLRDASIKRAKKKPGMSEAEYKEAIRQVRRSREKDASKVAAELDRKGVISDFATTLEQELERNIKAFSK